LPEVIFEIRDSTGNLVTTVTTDINGIVKVESLEFGEYRIAEVKAPKGYQLNSNEIKVSIDEKDPYIEITIENEKDSSVDSNNPNNPSNPSNPDGQSSSNNNSGGKTQSGSGPRLPQTGGNINNRIYMFLGVIFIVAGFGVLLKRKRLDKRS